MDIIGLKNKADEGNVVAQAILGACYLDGFRVEVDYSLAFRYLTSAASAGAARAEYNLGRIYLNGLGAPRDLVAAEDLFKRAASRGEFLAQIQLARIYAGGLTGKPNSELARSWYSAALAQSGIDKESEECVEAKKFLEREG